MLPGWPAREAFIIWRFQLCGHILRFDSRAIGGRASAERGSCRYRQPQPAPAAANMHHKQCAQWRCKVQLLGITWRHTRWDGWDESAPSDRPRCPRYTPQTGWQRSKHRDVIVTACVAHIRRTFWRPRARANCKSGGCRYHAWPPPLIGCCALHARLQHSSRGNGPPEQRHDGCIISWLARVSALPFRLGDADGSIDSKTCMYRVRRTPRE